MNDVQSFFLDENKRMGMGKMPIVGCCGFLSGWSETIKVIIPKGVIHNFISDDDFKLWIEIMKDINLPATIIKPTDEANKTIQDELKSYFRRKNGTSNSSRVIESLKKEFQELRVYGTSSGYYGITNKEMTSAGVIRYRDFARSVCANIEIGRDYKSIKKNCSAQSVTLEVLDHKNPRKIRGTYPVEPRHFKVVGTDMCLFDYFYKRLLETFNSMQIPHEENVDYHLVEINKSDFQTKVLPRSINSGLRMTYLDKYEGLIKKTLELKKKGFSSWDSLFLSHVVSSDREVYDYYNGFIKERYWYYQTEKMLKSRMMINTESTNSGFTKDHGVSHIDYSIIDKLLIDNNYEEILSYLKKVSFGDDLNIGKHAVYSGSENRSVTIGSHYEIIGSNEDSFLIIDNYFNERHIKKSKFTIDE